MFALKKSNRKIASRHQINISSISEGILELSQNEYRSVIETSSVNFELKSEKEQDILIDNYEKFLNSLPYKIQIVIRIRELDISKYISNIYSQVNTESNLIYKSQLEDYASFIKELIIKKKILSRHFYIIISPNSIQDFEAAKEELSVAFEIISKGLTKLGIHTRQLESIEILDLFYSFYNQHKSKIQPLNEEVSRILDSVYIRKTEA